MSHCSTKVGKLCLANWLFFCLMSSSLLWWPTLQRAAPALRRQMAWTQPPLLMSSRSPSPGRNPWWPSVCGKMQSHTIWDRSESLEVYSWSLPGLSDPKARNMRFPVVVCPNHWTVKETHMQIMEVLSWSFAALAEGCWPQHGPHGGVWHNPHSGSFGFLAACVEFKGDWKMLSSLIGLPMWKNKDGVCWRCQILKEEVKQVGGDAAWRLPQHRTSHGQLLSNLQAKGKMSPIWDFPGFEATCIRIDWLHVMDLGVTSYWFGAVLHLAVTMLHLGPNQKERVKAIFRAILAWYKRSGINSDRLKALPVTRFKPKGQSPALKASAGQVRALVPYFVELTSSWTQEMYNAEEWAEITLVQQGCRHLLDCYDCLSLSNPKPLSVLRREVHCLLHSACAT